MGKSAMAISSALANFKIADDRHRLTAHHRPTIAPSETVPIVCASLTTAGGDASHPSKGPRLKLHKAKDQSTMWTIRDGQRTRGTATSLRPWASRRVSRACLREGVGTEQLLQVHLAEHWKKIAVHDLTWIGPLARTTNQGHSPDWRS